MISKLDRFEGTLMGALGGDAFLAEFETKRSSEIVAHLIMSGGLVPRDYVEPFTGKRIVMRGSPTDDAELTAALATALCLSEFKPEAVYHALRDFIHGVNGNPRRSFLTEGEAYGSGGTLRSALREETYEASKNAFREGRVIAPPTNGSLMRNAPVALRFHGNMPMIIEVARRQSCITHVHPSAQAACIAHAVLLEHVLSGESPREAWKKTCEVLSGLVDIEKKVRDKLLSEDLLALIGMNRKMPREEEIWPNTGEVLISFRIALAAFLSSEDYREGLTKIAVVGGDTDTYGAIAGALLGARFGLKGIPKEWCSILQGRAFMLKLAKELHKLSKM